MFDISLVTMQPLIALYTNKYTTFLVFTLNLVNFIASKLLSVFHN